MDAEVFAERGELMDLEDILSDDEGFKEEWRDVKGYEGRYKVSNKGRVYSVPRHVSNHTGEVLIGGHLLKGSINYKGYKMMYLCMDGKDKMHFVHRLVANAFIPNPENKPQVNHIDGNKLNNYVTNLEWCTNGENQLHACRTGLNDHSKMAKKLYKKVNQIDPVTNEIIKTFESIKSAMAEFGIKSSSAIGKACKSGKLVKGYRWEFVDKYE